MKPTLVDVIANLVDQKIADIHTGLPGKIVSYDQNKKQASIQPSIKRVYTNGVVQSLPVISNVPVVFPQTKNGGIVFPLEGGDDVWLSFGERSLDTWLSLGGETEPGNDRKYDLSDAVAFPGINPFNVTNPVTNALALYYKSAKIKIGIDSKIAIGNDQAELLDIIDQILSVLITALPSYATQFTDLQTLLDKIKGSL